MTETEQNHFRELKQKVTDSLRAHNLSAYKDILQETDPRLLEYVSMCIDNPEQHNIYELCGVERFFLMRLKGYKWNRKRVQHFIKTWESFAYVDEEGAHHVKMSPVQVFIFANIYGWTKLKDGKPLRVIRNVIICTPRKVGKSTMIAGMAGYETIYGPKNAQTYIIANSLKQSKILYNMLKGIVNDKDPDNRFTKTNREALWLDTADRHSYCEALATNPTRLDGLNCSLEICDEYSQAKYEEVQGAYGAKKVIDSSMLARLEPLRVTITTASEVLDSPFVTDLNNAKEDYLHMISGEEWDETSYSIILQPDPWDDPEAEETWLKVQPHMGRTVYLDNYREDYKAMQKDPKTFTEFLTKYVNIFVEDKTTLWHTADEIQHAQRQFDLFNPSQWTGKMMTVVTCDFSVKDDFTAITYLAYSKKGRCFFSQTEYFLPEETVKTHRNRIIYEQWVQQGYIHIIPGTINDPIVIADTIISHLSLPHLDIRVISYDSREASGIIQRIRDYLRIKCGFSDKKINQGVFSYSQSIGNFNKALQEHDIALGQQKLFFHAPDDITPWCYGNATLIEDTNENQKPIKRLPHLKIDSTITNCMCFGVFGQYLAKQ